MCTAEGACVATAASAPAGAGPSTPVDAEDRPAEGDAGWATGAGVVGIATGIVGLGFAVGSAGNAEETETAIALGAAGTAVIAIGVPITAVGAASARGDERVRGALGARIAGWIGYGITIADALVLIGLGASDAEVPEGVIISVGLLGLASSAAMAVDAFVSGAQARRLMEEHPPVEVTRPDGVQWRPVLGASPTPQGGASGYLGVVGSF